jgi:NAD(P)-dependent dehydrogenase (short-subunit alcohol dehydrogenase family)
MPVSVLPGPDLFRLDGKVALVTGAGGDFGRNIALGLARSGATVCLTDIVDADETQQSLQGEGYEHDFWQCDVRRPDDVSTLLASVNDRFGRLEVLVNNAGVNPRQGDPASFPVEVWNDVIAINLTGYFLMAQESAKLMMRGAGGVIVNISSIAAASSLGRGNLAFGVSKAGVDQLTKELAVAWACHGIRVNAIQPCQFLSEGMRAWLDDPSSEATARRMLAGIPMGRMGEPEEVVGAVLFLASEAASMVTGAVLPIDGGNLALNPGGTIGHR